VGSQFAKGIAIARGVPYVAVNHLEAHALTARLPGLVEDGAEFPYLLLLVSGGHCQCVAVEGVGRYRRLARAPASSDDPGAHNPHRRPGHTGTERMNSRRSLIKALASAGALMMTNGIRAQQTSAPAAPIKRAIPSSGEQLPVIGLGTYQAFDVGNDPAAREPLKHVLHELVAKGGSVVDSSPMYGRAEGVAGDLSAELSLRASLFLATKVWTSGKEAGIRQMEQSFQLMRTQTMDLMQIHNLVDIDSQMGSVRDLKSKGRIRYTGITHSESRGFGEVEKAMRMHKPDFVQINYSLVERGAAQRILPLARDMRMGVIVNRPLGGGAVLKTISSKPLPPWAAEFDCHSWPQFLLKWILAHPAVTCVIPATNNPQHLEDNMAAGLGRLPDAKTRERMASLFVGFS